MTVDIDGKPVNLLMTGTIAQWFSRGERVKLVLRDEPKRVGNTWILGQNDYELYRI